MDCYIIYKYIYLFKLSSSNPSNSPPSIPFIPIASTIHRSKVSQTYNLAITYVTVSTIYFWAHTPRFLSSHLYVLWWWTYIQGLVPRIIAVLQDEVECFLCGYGWKCGGVWILYLVLFHYIYLYLCIKFWICKLCIYLCMWLIDMKVIINNLFIRNIKKKLRLSSLGRISGRMRWIHSHHVGTVYGLR